MKFDGVHIKIMQSTIERALYVLLAFMFIGIIVVGLLAYDDGQQIKKIITNHTDTIKTIEKNQHVNALAIKTYIACLISINPNDTKVQLAADRMTCFDNAPQVE